MIGGVLIAVGGHANAQTAKNREGKSKDKKAADTGKKKGARKTGKNDGKRTTLEKKWPENSSGSE